MKIWKQAVSLADLAVFTRDTLIDHLGIEFLEIGDDFLRARMPVDRRTKQPYGLLHGGASVALAETLGSLGAHLCTEKGTRSVGLEINANHVRAVTEGWVTGVARPLHMGRTTQVWEIRLTDDSGRLCCISRHTVAILPA